MQISDYIKKFRLKPGKNTEFHFFQDGNQKVFNKKITTEDAVAFVLESDFSDAKVSESSDSDTETPPSAHQLSESVLSENDEVPNVMLTSEPNKDVADIPDPSNDTSQSISSKPLLKRLSPQPKRRRTIKPKEQLNVKAKVKPKVKPKPKSKQKGSKTTPLNSMKSYDDDHNNGNKIPEFQPEREPGLHLLKSSKLVKELDFFQLFFTDEILEAIVKHTNTYAWLNITKKPSYASEEGCWTETTFPEMKRFIALLVYQGIVKVPRYEQYWSTKTLYHALWARSIMSQKRFNALLAFLHVVDPFTEKDGEKLKKVSPLISHFQKVCCELYQPEQNVAVDERIVKSKHRSGIIQAIH